MKWGRMHIFSRFRYHYWAHESRTSPLSSTRTATEHMYGLWSSKAAQRNPRKIAIRTNDTPLARLRAFAAAHVHIIEHGRPLYNALSTPKHHAKRKESSRAALRLSSHKHATTLSQRLAIPLRLIPEAARGNPQRSLCSSTANLQQDSDCAKAGQLSQPCALCRMRAIAPQAVEVLRRATVRDPERRTVM